MNPSASPVCPFPGCGKTIAETAVLCADHWLAIDPAQARFLIRMKVRARRSPDAETREHLESQLTGYVRNAIRRAEIQSAKEGKSAA